MLNRETACMRISFLNALVLFCKGVYSTVQFQEYQDRQEQQIYRLGWLTCALEPIAEDWNKTLQPLPEVQTHSIDTAMENGQIWQFRKLSSQSSKNLVVLTTFLPIDRIYHSNQHAMSWIILQQLPHLFSQEKQKQLEMSFQIYLMTWSMSFLSYCYMFLYWFIQTSVDRLPEPLWFHHCLLIFQTTVHTPLYHCFSFTACNMFFFPFFSIKLPMFTCFHNFI